MRLLATLLLAAMVVLFAISLHWRHAHPAMPWLQAFAEAGMIGGLADWFAVTALFRHPLGLPIPHTAIIPANKDRIGESLAVFLKENFLTPAIVARRLEEIDMAGAAARWLMADRDATPGARKRGWGPLVARLIEALDQRAIGDLVRETALEKLHALALSPIIADAIDTTVDRRRHEPVIESAIAWGVRTLDDQESTIRGMVAERTNWFLKLVSVDEQVSSSLIDGIRNLLGQMQADPHHPLRRRITEALRRYAFDLRHFPDSQRGIEAFKDDLIANPAMGQVLEGLWDDARAGLITSLTATGTPGTPSRLGIAMQALGERLAADAPLRAAINLHLRRAAVGLVNDYGDAIVSLVSTTIRSWDARTVTEKLETAVGRDLQFIRINGTIIGGCVGLFIHALSGAL